ncbi:MAG TPA: lipocalin family protein [Candidatus Paceibacterota bacterium]
MKKISLYLAGLVMIISSSFVSCKKDNPTPKTEQPGLSAKALLLVKTWTPVSATQIVSGTRVNDPLSVEEKKDTYTFKSDKTFSYVEFGGSGSFNGTWEPTANDTKIVLKASNSTITYGIITLTATSLELENETSPTKYRTLFK